MDPLQPLVAPVLEGVPLDAAELAALADGRAVVRDDWLGAEPSRALRAEVLELAARLRFEPAGMGHGSGWRVLEHLRGDEHAWLGPGAGGPALALYQARLEVLRLELAAKLRTSLERTELQLGRFSRIGAGYTRHLDAFRGGSGRRVTAIYYLAPHWAPEHGGALRVHLPEGPLDVAPHLDRLVLFASDMLEHEVLAVQRPPRLALSAWFGRDDPLGRLR